MAGSSKALSSHSTCPQGLHSGVVVFIVISAATDLFKGITVLEAEREGRASLAYFTSTGFVMV